MYRARARWSWVLLFSCGLGYAGQDDDARASFQALPGAEASEGAGKAFDLLLAGKEAEAYGAFQAAAAENPRDGLARFGLGLHEHMRGQFQAALEAHLGALAAAPNHAWAELFLEAALALGPACRNPKPLEETLRKLSLDETVAPALRDRTRRALAEWLLGRGR